jgi:hypothetical protein
MPRNSNGIKEYKGFKVDDPVHLKIPCVPPHIGKIARITKDIKSNGEIVFWVAIKCKEEKGWVQWGPIYLEELEKA